MRPFFIILCCNSSLKSLVQSRITGLSCPYLRRALLAHRLTCSSFRRTGLYPSSHGIVANDFWDPALQKEFVYTDSAKSWGPEWWGGEPVRPSACLCARPEADALRVHSSGLRRSRMACGVRCSCGLDHRSCRMARSLLFGVLFRSPPGLRCSPIPSSQVSLPQPGPSFPQSRQNRRVARFVSVSAPRSVLADHPRRSPSQIPPAPHHSLRSRSRSGRPPYRTAFGGDQRDAPRDGRVRGGLIFRDREAQLDGRCRRDLCERSWDDRVSFVLFGRKEGADVAQDA